MSDQYPVFVNVRRPDGSVEPVRVGTATRNVEGFVLQLGELSIGATPVAAPAPAPARSAPARASAGGAPTTFPPYGRSKGAPIEGASADDLQYYANGCRRTLADPGKSRWHEKEQELLAVIEAEMRRQGISPGAAGKRPRPAFMDAPPNMPEPPPGGEPPPPGDDDVPF